MLTTTGAPFGVYHDYAALLMDSVAVWDDDPALTPGRSGAIVNIASVVSTHAVGGQVHYAAAKAGVAELTRASAVELATDGIRVNAIAARIT